MLREHDRSTSFWGTVWLVLIVLKLTGNLAWSWFWVLSPLVAFPLLALIVFGLQQSADERKARKASKAPVARAFTPEKHEGVEEDAARRDQEALRRFQEREGRK